MTSRPADMMVEVSEPATGVAVAPTIVTELTRQDQLPLLQGDVLPATVIVHLDASLRVVDGKGAELSGLESVLDSISGRTIPAFYVHDEATARNLSGWLNDNSVTDAFVVSDSRELVAQVRRAHPIIRGVIDYRAASEPDLLEVRREANSHLSRIVLLPQSLMSREDVGFLQRLLITVWLGEQNSDLPPAVNAFNLVATGTNGIVSADPRPVIDILESAFPQDRVSLVRKPFIIGHRGVPGRAPENTLEGARLAFEHGADMIENDVYVTSDGAVVIHHDPTLDRTTTGSGPISGRSLAELQELLANRQFPEEFPSARLPTLRQYFAEFKGRSVVHVIELKSPDPALIAPLVALIREFEVEDQVVAISFHAEQIRLLQEQLPGVSTGFLTGGQVSEAAPLLSLHHVLQAVQPLNSTFNPNYLGLGGRFLEAAKHRGITSWPWTFRHHGDFVNLFLAGLNGLTTDHCYWSEEWVDGVKAQDPLVQLTVGTSASLTATASGFGRSSFEFPPAIVVLEGAELVRVDGSSLQGVAAGTAWVALRHWQQVDDERGYFMYSGAVRVEVSAA